VTASSDIGARVPRTQSRRRYARTAHSGRATPSLPAPELVGLDALALLIAWGLSLLLPGISGTDLRGRLLPAIGISLIVTVASLFFASSQRLYLARVCVVRAEEKARLARVALFTFVAGLLACQLVNFDVSYLRLAVATVLTFLVMAGFRLGYHQYLRVSRARGRFARPILLVGANDEAVELSQLLVTHPEIGMRMVGVVGDRSAAAKLGIDLPYAGEIDDLDRIVQETGVSGVLIVSSALAPHQTRKAIRDLLEMHVHVHLSTGLMGFDYRRVRALPLSHEPLFYVEPLSLARWQFWIKRVIDLTAASLCLVIAAPLLLVAGIAIKLQDRGPMMFRQVRIGRDGKPFTFFKLRTMRVAAEQGLSEVHHRNERNGPLFKDVADPRRTRVGRVLEAASIDELPQLINVLRGDMSLVGPRPALPHEVAQFDDELLSRHRMRPGITGLWQVESRDNPSFQAYRRLDLFYVENWSISLDLAILFTTGQVVFTRALQRVFNRFSHSVVPTGDVASADPALVGDAVIVGEG
jgi:exopolysaccharide biosynthesis polyprenyl glycosylphosphotransferase